MTQSGPDLSDLRRQIDDIDDKIQKLLIKRTGIVEQVRLCKEGERVKIRPAREAEIIYRLFAQHKGPLSKRELFRMWRELIVATLRFEGPFSAAVYMPRRSSGFWDLARDQYGSFTPMSSHTSVRRVIDMVSRQDATVGIVPMPEREENDPWWPNLVTENPEAPKVIAKLPFCGPGNNREPDLEALVLCPVPQEATGRDVTYLAIDSICEISRDKLEKTVNAAGLQPKLIADYHDPDSRDQWLYLIEAGDFVKPKDRRLGRVKNSLGKNVRRIVNLGGYAEPVGREELDEIKPIKSKIPPRRRAKAQPTPNAEQSSGGDT